MRISDWSSDVCSSDLFGLLLKDDEPVRILERRDGPGRLVIVVQRLGRGDQRSAIFAAGARIGFDEVGHRAAAQHLPRFIEEQGLRVARSTLRIICCDMNMIAVSTTLRSSSREDRSESSRSEEHTSEPKSLMSTPD